MSAPPEELRGSAVVLGGRGLLLTGRPGSGKSTLALELIALGAMLVADDIVLVSPAPEALTIRAAPEAPVMRAPARLAGLIEARGIGILRLTYAPEAPLRLIADLDRDEPERVPPARTRDLPGCRVALVWAAATPGRAARLAATLTAEACLGPGFRPE